MQLLTTTFLFTIIHEDSTSENRDNGSFSLTVCQEALSERRFGKQKCDSYIALIPKHLVDDADFFRDISFEKEI